MTFPRYTEPMPGSSLAIAAALTRSTVEHPDAELLALERELKQALDDYNTTGAACQEINRRARELIGEPQKPLVSDDPWFMYMDRVMSKMGVEAVKAAHSEADACFFGLLDYISGIHARSLAGLAIKARYIEDYTAVYESIVRDILEIAEREGVAAA